MISPVRSWLAAAALVLLGCGVENPDHVEDSTGAEMGWGCVSGRCGTVRESFSAPVPACEGDDTELLVGAGPIAILCAVSVDEEGEDVVHELMCRPLVCADALDCPQWVEREYACVEGLCQVAMADGWELDRLDLIALCLHDVPRHGSCREAEADPTVVDRLARVEEVCEGEGCTGVPEGCRVP